MDGLHFVGDLRGCRCSPERLVDGARFERDCVDMVRESGLLPMDVRFHQFEGAGYTGTVVLAESHVAVHSWPEQHGVTLDVYVCNYSADNRERARRLFDALVAYFDPADVVAHVLERGVHTLSESVSDSTVFSVKAAVRLEAGQDPARRLELYETAEFGKLLRRDGANMTSERDEFIYHENLVHPSLSAQPAPKKVLIIGGGDGGAAEEVLKHPSVEEVTLIEPDSDVVSLARDHLHAIHRGVFGNPKLRVLHTDCVRFLRETSDKYDFIALDLGDPVGPFEALYGVPFFQQLRHALLPGGAVALHIGSPIARPERVTEIAQRLNSVFRIVRPYTVYVPVFGSLWAMATCSDKLDPKAYTADEIDRRIEQRKLQDLRYYNGETHEGVFALPNFVREMVAPPRVKVASRGRRLGVVAAAR